MGALALWFFVVAAVFGDVAAGQGTFPEQIHLSYGANEWELVVTWSTRMLPELPFVEYEGGGERLRASGTTRKFVDGGLEKRSQYIHTVVLRELKPTIKYVYRCGSGSSWSPSYWFVTPPTTDWSPKIAIVGDLGSVNAVSLPTLQRRVSEYSYDAVIHVGDIAYDMADNNGRVGDTFMNQIQPVAARVPYMLCPGNHEHAYNFSHFRKRFDMPGDAENLFYSFNMGPVHFVSINTEAYFFLKYGVETLVRQYNWLINDLKEASQNRGVRPWIIAYGHRPMYCSGLSAECEVDAPTRSGIFYDNKKQFGLEAPFMKYGVDLALWGHQHNYERLFPIFNNTVLNGTKEEPYIDPKAPVHIVTGSAGCDEAIEPFEWHPIPASAVRSLNYTYTEMQVHNGTHLSLRQIATDADDTVIDEILIVKHRKFPTHQ